MNSTVRSLTDGMTRRLFRVDDLFRMEEAGILRPDERIELVGGEMLPMAAKGIRHEVLKIELNQFFGDNRPAGIGYAPEPGWKLDELHYLEPDFILYPRSLHFSAVTGRDALLVIEVSDSTLNYDSGLKAAVYASFGVREYWVIDAVKRRTTVHLSPGNSGYAHVRSYDADDVLQPQWISGLALKLADIPE